MIIKMRIQTYKKTVMGGEFAIHGAYMHFYNIPPSYHDFSETVAGCNQPSVSKLEDHKENFYFNQRRQFP